MTSWTKFFVNKIIGRKAEESIAVKSSHHLRRYLTNTLLMGFAYGGYSLYQAHKESPADEKVKKNKKFCMFIIFT